MGIIILLSIFIIAVVMTVKEIKEGMKAPEVAQTIKDNFDALNNEKETVENVGKVKEGVDNANKNTGVSNYPEFSATEDVAVGVVRNYNGLLYRSIVAGANEWNEANWERVSLESLQNEKLTELASKVGNVSKSFLIESGSNHSSNNDRITINANTGDSIEISVKSSNETSSVKYAVYGYTADGIDDFLFDGYTSDESKEVILKKNYTEIGVYIQSANYSHTITFTCKSAISTLYKKVDSINNGLNVRGYFTDAQSPIITASASHSYTIKMPICDLRIYGNNGILFEIPLNGEEYNISSLQSLVYSIKNDEIKIVGTSGKTSDDIVLFETLGTGEPLGAISQYYLPKKLLEDKCEQLDNRLQIVTYLSSASKPTFNFLEDSSVVVTLPNGALRLYDRRDNIVKAITIAENERIFTIPIYSALIFDITEGNFKVIDLTEAEIQTNDTYILLFNKSVGICDGLFSEYFNRFIEQRNTWSIQDAMSNNYDNISVENGKITIKKGFSLVNGIGRFAIECTNNYIIKPLDDISGARVVRTFVYIDTFILGATTYLDGENAKNIFVIKSAPEDIRSGRYLLFATFYYQTPSGGMIDVYRNSINGSISNLYKNELLQERRNQCRFRSDFNCLLFSDIHASESNLERIIDLANDWGNKYIDVIVNGGDTASNHVTDGYDWYNQLVDESSIDVLAAAGNHDEWIDSNWNWADSSIVYNAIIAPIAAKVEGLVQPTNAASEGKLYYYKDYNNKVRIIVLETTTTGSKIPYWNAEQSAWMQSVLEDARLNNLAVICMTHPPFAKGDGRIDESITFNSWTGYRIDVVDDKTSIKHDPLAVVDDALTNIDTFINNGGKFICWLAGHTHLDYFVKSDSHPNQVMFVTASANYLKSEDCESSSDKSSQMYDCMTYIGIDIDKFWLKILRIGRNLDGFLREKNVLVYDLNNHEVITNY